MQKCNAVFVPVMLSIALFLSAILLFQLLDDKFLKGSDAYYYALQAWSWFNTGEVRIPDSNIIHRITGFMQYFGLNTETALKLWTAGSYFLFLSAFVLLLKDFKSRFLAALIFSWAALSPSILFICIELPKTFLFLIFFNLAFYYLKNTEFIDPAAARRMTTADCADLCFLKNKKTSSVINPLQVYPARSRRIESIKKFCRNNAGRFALAGILFLCLLIHKMALIYIGVICIYFFIRKRIGVKEILIVFAAALLCAAVYKFLIIDHFHIADFTRLKSLNLIPGVISLFLNGVLLPALKAEFIAAAVLAGFLFYLNKSNLKPPLLPLLLMLTVFIPAMDNEILSAGGRFGLLFSHLFILSAVYLLEEKSAKMQKNLPQIFIYAAVIAAGFFHLNYSYPQKHRVKNYEEYDKLISQISGKDIPMLIAHKSFHYYYKYKTGNEAFSYEPEKHWDKKRVWRLVSGATPEEMFFYMPEYASWDSEYIFQFSGLHYALIREDCYFDMRNSVPEEKNPELYNALWNNEINPSIPRPAFLYKKHKEDKNSEFPAVFDS